MQDIVYEDLFSRTFGYLRQGGVAVSRESALTALKLIEELLVAESADVIDRVIVELPRRLEFSGVDVPRVCPPLNRGSIGYGDR